MSVVVVGLGPAGIIACRVLAAAGIAVTAIQPSAANGRAPLAAAIPTVRRTIDEPARPAPAPHAGADGIGGSKRLAAPQSYRMDEGAFHVRTAAGRIGDRAALDTDVSDWPMTSNGLADYHERVERLLQVAPRPPSPWTERMSRAASRCGWTPFAAPAARSTDMSPLLPPGISVLDATATRIRTRASGAVAGVVCIDATGAVHDLPCRTLVLAASVIPTIRLLLLSGIDDSGRVGSGFMAHNAFTVNGWFPDEDLERDQGSAATAVAISDFEAESFDHTGLGFLGGSVLQAAMTGARTDAWLDAAATDLPRGLGRRTWVRRQARSIGTVWAQPDQLPRRENRIDLDPTHLDAAGLPVARITYDLADDDHARARFLSERMEQWLMEAGAARTWSAALSAQPLGTHLYGGVRMGSDPLTSVVDDAGFAHRVFGLVVLGTATFPTPGGRGPVQTVEALAWRSAERVAERHAS
ncbi:MAG: GMC oxidoreductase [Microbacterium sp.]